MPRSSLAALVAAALMVAGALALRAGWDAGDGGGEQVAAATTAPSTTVPPTTVPNTAPATTEGTNVTFPGTGPTTSPPPGLPPDVPVPAADVITVSPGSSYTTRFEVPGASSTAVLDWLEAGLESAGWEVLGRSARAIAFAGPGAAGTASVTGRDPVLVEIALAPR